MFKRKRRGNFKENRERVRVKTMCGQKVVDRKSEEQMDMLGLIVNHF